MNASEKVTTSLKKGKEVYKVYIAKGNDREIYLFYRKR